MKLRHFETLGPICPGCRADSGLEHQLTLALIGKQEGSDIIEGLLQCPADGCLREYPIIDGIPLLVPDVRGYLASQLQQLISRDDLTPAIEDLLAEAAGPGAPLTVARSHLSSYTWDHYSEWDPSERSPGDNQPGSVARTLARGVALGAESGARFGPGPLLDLGCAVGRSTFELARETDQPVIGVDLGFHFLRIAGRALRRGSVRYPLRRGGLLYDWREFPVPTEGGPRVDFWACDAIQLPFPAATFGGAVALNLIDCVYSPLDLLRSLARVLRPGATLVLASPYDWSPAATAIEGWIGGHSPRSPGAGASESVLRALLTPGGHSAAVADLELIAERDGVPWVVRIHDRSAVHYRLHLVLARRRPDSAPTKPGS